MIKRTLLFFSLLPLSAFAQIQIFQFDGTNETPPGGLASGALVNFGTAAPSDSIVARFKVHNIGTGPVALQTLGFPIAQSQDNFTISSAPSLGYVIAPGSATEFRITFQAPLIIGSFSAILQVNTISLTLRGIAAPSAILTEGSSQTPLVAGAVIDFGSATLGTSNSLSFTLKNTGTGNITLGTVTVGGDPAFHGPIGLPTPIQLPPLQTASFQIAFTPQTGQAAQGILTVDQRVFDLKGVGLNPALPSAAIALASSLGASAQQNSISITLATASQVAGTGTLHMGFQSSVPGIADDPAIRFLSGPKRDATVTIAAGASAGSFGGQTSIAFQTGTTAGTIVFTLTLPSGTQQTSLTVTPSPISFDLTTAIRKVGELDVSLAGFDNTYSASQLAFTFYNAKGATLQPGVIRVDATDDFRQYFASATAGGTFAMLSRFLVTGDTSQIASVDVQIFNSAGNATVQKIPIGN